MSPPVLHAQLFVVSHINARAKPLVLRDPEIARAHPRPQNNRYTACETVVNEIEGRELPKAAILAALQSTASRWFQRSAQMIAAEVQRAQA